MKNSLNSQQQDKKYKDVLYQFRDQIFYRFSLAGLILIFPFSLNNLMQGRIVSGTSSFLVLLIFLVDAIAMRMEKRPPVPPAIVCIPIIFGIGVTIGNLGFIAAVWIYPAIVLFFFILPRVQANIIGVISSIVTTCTAYYYGFDIQVTSRILASSLLTLIFINILFSFINQLNERLQKAAIIDDLTGVYNRRHLNATLKNVLNYKERYSTTFSLLTLDIDNFKSINDEYGHFTGDDILKKFAQLLQGTLRKVDSVFRVGGEEFNVLLPESDLQQAAKVAEKIRETIFNELKLYNRNITVSIGVGELNSEESIDDLLKRCDKAMYKAKQQGKNRVCLSR